MKRLRRTMLFIPGNNPGMLQNAGILGADSIIFDLEDAVSLQEKDSARILVSKAIREVDFGNCEVVVRINPLNSPYGRADLEAIAAARPDTIIIPKADAEQIQLAAVMLDALESVNEIKSGMTKLIPLIESAYGLETIAEVIRSSSRNVAILFGGKTTPRTWVCVEAKPEKKFFTPEIGLQQPVKPLLWMPSTLPLLTLTIFLV